MLNGQYLSYLLQSVVHYFDTIRYEQVSIIDKNQMKQQVAKLTERNTELLQTVDAISTDIEG